eukprot:5637634-Pleurochrysis_carterae.AAC.1
MCMSLGALRMYLVRQDYFVTPHPTLSDSVVLCLDIVYSATAFWWHQVMPGRTCRHADTMARP